MSATARTPIINDNISGVICLQLLHLVRYEARFSIALRYLPLDCDTHAGDDDLLVFFEDAGEDDHLDRVGKIGNFEKRHTFAFLGENRPYALDEAADHRIDATEIRFGVFDGSFLVVEFRIVFVERMAGDVEAEQFLFPRKALVLRGGRGGGEAQYGRCRRESAEE